MKVLLPKIYHVVLIMFLFSNVVDAQKIKYSKGLVTLDGKPYVKLIKKVKYIIVHNNFWVQNLDGKELMSAEVKERITNQWNKQKYKYEDVTSYYYVIHFKESEAKVVLNRQFSKKGLIKMILKNKLIIDNQIDPVAERKYILDYGGSLHGIKSTASVVIKEDQIFHYDKLLGTFLTQSSLSEKGIAETSILVYNNDGEKVAEGIAPDENAIEWSVYTYSDEKKSFIKYKTPNEKEVFFKWLSDKKYL